MLFKFVVSGPFVFAGWVGCKVCCHFRVVPRASRGVCACFPQVVVVGMLSIKMRVGGVLRVFAARGFHVPLVVPASPVYCVACCNEMISGSCKG